ncbi:MAG: glycerate kinase [Planctomycetota bacterium]
MQYDSEQLKVIVKNLYTIAVESVNPYKLTLDSVKFKSPILEIGDDKIDISRYEHIYVIGAGKAAIGMAMALEKILTVKEPADLITKGQISISYGSGKDIALNKIRVIEAGHPIPNEASILGAKKIKELLKEVTKNDLVFYLATGGGSSVITMPTEGITLKDLQDTFQLLIKSKAPLSEINYIRKHIDITKGGQLAQDAYPANIITLVLSDVVGDQIDLISSGPTVPDPYTFNDAYQVLRKYNLWQRIPESVRNRIKKGLRGEISETPKENETCFERSKAFLIGTNKTALNNIAEKISSLGYDVFINEEPVVGEARKTASIYASKVLEMAKEKSSLLFIISGGETIVTIQGNGIGGRNQEFALAFALQMEQLGFERYICLSCSTDGIDYIIETAGAMVDGTSLKKARKLGLNPQQLLDNNDSYHFHESIKTLIKTGPTGTNVNDIQIVVIW